MRKELGYILLTMLLLVSALTIISVMTVNGELKVLRISDHQLLRQRANLEANQFLLQILPSLSTSCKVNRRSAKDFIKAPLAFWQNQACAHHNQDFIFFYKFESLGVSNCGRIFINRKAYVAGYYRVSILVWFKHLTGARALFQMTIARPDQLALLPLCSEEIYPIKAGLQMQRELISEAE